jgi:glycosyltransferase involved in cell wall biosynthesis
MEQVQKVLMVCKALPDTFAGGIQTAVWALSGALIDRGLEVSILTAGPAFRAAERVVSDGRILERIPYLPARKLPVGGMVLEERAFNFAAMQWIRQHGSEYDIIHLQGRSGSQAMHIKRKLPPIIATFHGCIRAEKSQLGFDNPADRLFYPLHASRWEKMVWRSANGIIVVSKALDRELRQSWGTPAAPLECIPNGSHVFEEEPEPPQLGQPLLFVGRIEPIKGLMFLLEAMKGLPEQIHLRVIGDGSEKARAEEFVKENGLSGRVSFLGRQPGHVVMQEVLASYLVVVPSLFEPQGIVVLEAFQGSRPVVASAVGGIPEMVTNGQNGLLVPPADVNSLRNALESLWQNPEKSVEMGRKGRETSRFATWGHIAKLTHEFYAKVRNG